MLRNELRQLGVALKLQQRACEDILHVDILESLAVQ